MTDMFKINEYGEVIREGNIDNSVLYNETAEKEISLLAEAVFRHPEHYSEQALNEKKKQLDELWKKYGLENDEVIWLEYSVFNHPERCSEQELNNRKKRLDDLWKKYGKDDNSVLKLAKRKLELKSSADKSLLNNAFLNLKKNKDAGL